MNEDDIIRDEELVEGDAPLEESEGKKKELLDDEVESVEELAEEELEEEDEPFDDQNPI